MQHAAYTIHYLVLSNSITVSAPHCLLHAHCVYAVNGRLEKCDIIWEPNCLRVTFQWHKQWLQGSESGTRERQARSVLNLLFTTPQPLSFMI